MLYARMGYDMTLDGAFMRSNNITEEESAMWWWLYLFYGAEEAHRLVDMWACRAAAESNGVSMAQADNCWERLVGCPDCPFNKGKLGEDHG